MGVHASNMKTPKAVRFAPGEKKLVLGLYILSKSIIFSKDFARLFSLKT
jgi:hypothetical protein